MAYYKLYFANRVAISAACSMFYTLLEPRWLQDFESCVEYNAKIQGEQQNLVLHPTMKAKYKNKFPQLETTKQYVLLHLKL